MGRKKLMKKNKSESTGLTCQTWDPCHESVITKQKTNLILKNEIKQKKLIEKKKANKKKAKQKKTKQSIIPMNSAL